MAFWSLCKYLMKGAGWRCTKTRGYQIRLPSHGCFRRRWLHCLLIRVCVHPRVSIQTRSLPMAGQDSLPLRRLKEFQPLNRLTDDQLVLLASRAERRTHGPGQRVLERGVRDGLDFFLIAGKVE